MNSMDNMNSTNSTSNTSNVNNMDNREIDLREVYPFHLQDKDIPQTVMVTEDIYNEVKAVNSFDESLRRANRRNRIISLDTDDGVKAAISVDATTNIANSNDPVDILEMIRWYGYLYCALHSLPKVQRRRIVKHFIKCKSQAEIAKEEKVSVTAVNGSIKKGRKNMRQKLIAYETGSEFCDVIISIKDDFDWKEFQ